MNKYINADINGALNIYRKSSVCDMKAILYLLRRGEHTKTTSSYLRRLKGA